MKPSIYITRKLPDECVLELQEKFDVKMWDHEEISVPREVLFSEIEEVDALFTVVSDPVTEELLAKAKNLRVVANMAVGYDNIDIEAATKRGIYVCNTPDVLTETTADLTFALLLAAARRVVEAAEFIKEGKWQSWSPFLLAGHDVYQKTIGICGMGKIGEAVARRAKGFGMEILYHNRSRKPQAEQVIGAKYCSFDELIEKSDFVVALAPLTAETKHMFNADVFKKMKHSALFINASRGAVADEASLYDALVDKQIAGAGLDVFEQEPISADHPLLKLANVTALPHIGSASIDTRRAMIHICVENIQRILTGQEPKTLVNTQLLER
ncbi:D-glycerate dehydrogenase [Mesobacillus maritimus]|uniref:2-hydroxyacid dehydrogenase n=1 Tax=Mesobacillus maritimus TaxID=1643336 RepID=UPI00204254AF|nr:D-glycerate dehydrogenase [Mesobacillus maritimus]MCM3585047.1 D-glycerate dehydrogenase [Mesobacillus maritimus]MCM3670251.1 D-glycerate dehydrogenase [Mesobacillus maritimus]